MELYSVAWVLFVLLHTGSPCGDLANMSTLQMCSQESIRSKKFYIKGMSTLSGAGKCDCAINADVESSVTLSPGAQFENCNFGSVIYENELFFSCVRTGTAQRTLPANKTRTLSFEFTPKGSIYCVLLESDGEVTFTCTGPVTMTTTSVRTTSQTEDTTSQNHISGSSSPTVFQVSSDSTHDKTTNYQTISHQSSTEQDANNVATTDTFMANDKQIPVAAIAGGTAGGVLVLVIVIVVAICICRRKPKEPEQGIVMDDNVAYESSSALSKNQSPNQPRTSIKEHAEGREKDPPADGAQAVYAKVNKTQNLSETQNVKVVTYADLSLPHEESTNNTPSQHATEASVAYAVVDKSSLVRKS